MIDIKFLRENPEIVKQNIKNKFQDSKLPLVDEVIELDKENRKTIQLAEELRANRNKYSKEIGALMAQGKKDEAMEMKNLVTQQSQQLAEQKRQHRAASTVETVLTFTQTIDGFLVGDDLCMGMLCHPLLQKACMVIMSVSQKNISDALVVD